MVRNSREEWKIYKNVFDKFTERTLFEMASKGYFVELVSPIALGKEANVFSASTKDGGVVMVKIYRLENCNFNKMYYYISSDPRFSGIENQKRKIIFNWVQREYRNLLIAREKISVPTPIAFKNNVLIMEYIGDDDAAPQLKDKRPENPEEFFRRCIDYVKKLIDAGLVHADLSDFNILNYNENPIFIDMSQSTPIKTQNASELLERDMKNLLSAFKRSLKIDEEKVMDEVMKHFYKKLKEAK